MAARGQDEYRLAARRPSFGVVGPDARAAGLPNNAVWRDYRRRGNAACSSVGPDRNLVQVGVAQHQLAVPGGDVEHHPPDGSLPLVQREISIGKERLERGRTDVCVLVVGTAINQRLDTQELSVGQGPGSHMHRHVQPLLGWWVALLTVEYRSRVTVSWSWALPVRSTAVSVSLIRPVATLAGPGPTGTGSPVPASSGLSITVGATWGSSAAGAT